MGAMSATWYPFSMAMIAASKRDDGFAGADVALQQTPHGIGLLHVGGDLFEHLFLRGGGMKRQNLLDRRARCSFSWKAIPVCAFCSRRLSSSPSSMKNSSSKISRICAGVRDDCRSLKLSPARANELSTALRAERRGPDARGRRRGWDRADRGSDFRARPNDAAKPARGELPWPVDS